MKCQQDVFCLFAFLCRCTILVILITCCSTTTFEQEWSSTTTAAKKDTMDRLPVLPSLLFRNNDIDDGND